MPQGILRKEINKPKKEKIRRVESSVPGLSHLQMNVTDSESEDDQMEDKGICCVGVCNNFTPEPMNLMYTLSGHNVINVITGYILSTLLRSRSLGGVINSSVHTVVKCLSNIE